MKAGIKVIGETGVESVGGYTPLASAFAFFETKEIKEIEETPVLVSSAILNVTPVKPVQNLGSYSQSKIDKSIETIFEVFQGVAAFGFFIAIILSVLKIGAGLPLSWEKICLWLIAFNFVGFMALMLVLVIFAIHRYNKICN